MFEAAKTSGLTKEQKAFLKRHTSGTWTYSPATGLVDVDGDFSFRVWDRRQKAQTLKGIKFGKVSGNFYCQDNQLTTLEGAPREVGGNFDCSSNNLTTPEGAPQKVGGYFRCLDNQLTTLEGAPQKVGGYFWCDSNQLTTLEGAPREVGGDFNCDKNQLTSLEGAPQKVGGDFSCENNQLTTLERAPREVGGGFYCGNNPVSRKTLKNIFSRMEKGESYLKAVGSLWTEIPVEDQTLLYRPEFEWVGTDERRKLDALRAYQGFKGMI